MAGAASALQGLAADMAVAGQYVGAAMEGAVEGSPLSALTQGVLVRSCASCCLAGHLQQHKAGSGALFTLILMLVPLSHRTRLQSTP